MAGNSEQTQSVMVNSGQEGSQSTEEARKEINILIENIKSVLSKFKVWISLKISKIWFLRIIIPLLANDLIFKIEARGIPIPRAQGQQTINNAKILLLQETRGDEAGIKSTTVKIEKNYLR